MTPAEVDAQCRAAEIRTAWMRDNPPPIRRTGEHGRMWRAEMVAYKKRWLESAAFQECCEVMKREAQL